MVLVFDVELCCVLEVGDFVLIVFVLGMFFEEIVDYLSWMIGFGVIWWYGDCYMFGDFWFGVVKKLRKSFVIDMVNWVDELLQFRNLVGVYYNEWVWVFMDVEVCEFGEVVFVLFDLSFCSSCGRWIGPL